MSIAAIILTILGLVALLLPGISELPSLLG